MIGLFGFLSLWATARWWAWPRALFWGLMALWGAVLCLVHAPVVGVPALAQVVGGDFKAWVLLALMVALIAGYRQGLAGLRRRGRPPVAPAAPDPAPDGGLSGAELNRYARHILLREIGGPGQRRLKAARVLVVGAGGLGSPALLYLAASGVGTLGVIDDDAVEASNLQRQIIHSVDRVGMPKVFSAAEAVAALNPHVALRPYNRRLTAEIAAELIADYDLVLDGSDSFDTRYLVNRACVAAAKPLVAGAITQWEGQLSVWHPAAGAPCYECVFPTRPAPGLVPTCAEAGVAAPLPGILGTMMAAEAVKLITGAGTPLLGRLLIQDSLHAETRVISLRRRADCPCCGPAPA